MWEDCSFFSIRTRPLSQWPMTDNKLQFYIHIPLCSWYMHPSEKRNAGGTMSLRFRQINQSNITLFRCLADTTSYISLRNLLRNVKHLSVSVQFLHSDRRWLLLFSCFRVVWHCVADFEGRRVVFILSKRRKKVLKDMTRGSGPFHPDFSPKVDKLFRR